MTKYVYDLAEGNTAMVALLGEKGANLAKMAKLGLLVPPGFIITTEACREFPGTGAFIPGLHDEITQHLDRLEETTGKQLGDPEDPLLVSVGVEAKLPAPGTMGRVSGIGLNDESVVGLTKQSGHERFAWESYRRFIEMFAQTVMGVDEGLLERARAEMRVERNAGSDLGLDVADLKELVAVYLDIVAQEAGCAFVRSPRAQLEAIIAALFRSRDGERAPIGRQQGRTPDGPGTAITVDMMVFGNLGLGSGTGVAFSRDPATGNRAVCGRYLQDAQREDLAAGARHTVPLGELEHLDERVYGQLLRIMSALEYHYGQPCQIGFTIERGRLWVLQATIGKRAAPGPTVTGRATTAQGLGRLGAESFRVLAQPGTRR